MIRRTCISKIVTFAVGLPLWMRSANALGIKDFNTDAIDRAVLEAKLHFKPGIAASEVEAFFRKRNYNFAYLEPGRIELQQDKAHRRRGIDFVARYFGTSPYFEITDKRGTLIMIIEITCYMGRSNQLLLADIKSTVYHAEIFE